MHRYGLVPLPATIQEYASVEPGTSTIEINITKLSHRTEYVEQGDGISGPIFNSLNARAQYCMTPDGHGLNRCVLS
jgi:hypothetical protein